jgi:hypothetical protein
MNKKIIAVVVDTAKLTLYHEDGSSIDIPQGDARVSHIISKVLPVVSAGGSIEADYSSESFYRQFEEQTNGFVRFFRATKKALASVFAAPESLGDDENMAEIGAYGQFPNQSAQQAAIDEIMANAQPVSSSGYQDKDTTEDHTIVAVVGDTIIPGAEQLHNQIRNSVKLGSDQGMKNFFSRIAKVVEKRRHSVEDLLKFLERGDLPIADDGSVIAYKLLNKRGDGVYVDVHSGKVTQRVGSFVYMNENMVDPNRRRDCSNGLHIARRGYLRSFPGNVCVLCKIAPEDFIAVPEYDANKVRVCGYHIVAELSDQNRYDLQAGKAMTSDPKAAKLLGAVIAGHHIGIIERVQITEPKGGGLKIETINEEQYDAAKARNAEPAHAIEDTDTDSAPVDPKNVANDIKPQAAKPNLVIPKTVQTNGRVDRARSLMTVIIGHTDSQNIYKAAQELLSMKKAQKVGWTRLGLTDADGAKATAIATGPAPKAAPKPKPTPAPKAAPKPKDKKLVTYKAPAKPNGKTETREQRVTRLVTCFYSTSPMADRLAAAQELIDIQKTARKGWASLGQSGLSNGELEQFINTNKNVPVAATPANPNLAGSGDRQTKARALYDAQDWTNLLAFKRKAKVSWDRLGFSEAEMKIILSKIGG